ncbi:hypothetical protein FQA39_LY00810 [Lamprigera yunnana]|nr:hypothetical protein FQA39_LY00810 [Lamprigera yunnana]
MLLKSDKEKVKGNRFLLTLAELKSDFECRMKEFRRVSLRAISSSPKTVVSHDDVASAEVLLDSEEISRQEPNVSETAKNDKESNKRKYTVEQMLEKLDHEIIAFQDNPKKDTIQRRQDGAIVKPEVANEIQNKDIKIDQSAKINNLLKCVVLKLNKIDTIIQKRLQNLVATVDIEKLLPLNFESSNAQNSENIFNHITETKISKNFDFKTAASPVPKKNTVYQFIERIEFMFIIEIRFALVAQLQQTKEGNLNIDEYGKSIESLMADLTIAQAGDNGEAIATFREANETITIDVFTRGISNQEVRTVTRARNFKSLSEAINTAKEESVVDVQNLIFRMQRWINTGFHRNGNRDQNVFGSKNQPPYNNGEVATLIISIETEIRISIIMIKTEMPIG